MHGWSTPLSTGTRTPTGGLSGLSGLGTPTGSAVSQLSLSTQQFSYSGLGWEEDEKQRYGTAFEHVEEGDAEEPLIPHVSPAGWADDQDELNAFRGPLSFVEANWFKVAIGAVILMNGAVFLLSIVNPEVKDLAHVADQVFLAVYCTELALRIGHWRLKFFWGSQEVGWNWFDFIIVVSGVAEELVALQLSSDSHDSAAAQGKHYATRIQMALRVLRPLRLLARLARFMRVIRLLRVLIVADFAWVESDMFQSIVGVVILFNAAIMGLETDVESPVWEWIEQFLLTFFVIEASLRIRQRSLDFFTSPEDGGWNILDLTIVVSGVVDDWLLRAWRVITRRNDKGSDLGKLMTLARLMRLMRILRLIRVVRAIRPLYMLAIGVVRAMQSMFWVLVLTFVALYALAILTTRAVGQGDLLADPDAIPEETKLLFGSIADSMFTLFAFMNSQEWHKVAPLLDLMPWTKLLFVVFTIYSSWALLSVMTGVVSDHIQYVREVQRQEDQSAQDERQDQLIRTLSQIFAAADPDGSGSLQRAIYMEILNSPFQVRRLQKAVNLHIEDIKQIFDLLDLDGNGTVNFDEFCESLDWLSKPVTGRRLLKVDLGVKLVSSLVQQGVADARQEFHRFNKDLDKQHRDLMGRLVDFVSQDHAVRPNFGSGRSLSNVSLGTEEKSSASDTGEVRKKFVSQRSLSSGLMSHGSADSSRGALSTSSPRSVTARPTASSFTARYKKNRSLSFDNRGEESGKRDPQSVAGIFHGSSGQSSQQGRFKKSLSWGPTDEVE